MYSLNIFIDLLQRSSQNVIIFLNEFKEITQQGGKELLEGNTAAAPESLPDLMQLRNVSCAFAGGGVGASVGNGGRSKDKIVIWGGGEAGEKS